MPSSAAIGRIEVRTQLARDDVGDPARAAAARACWPTPPSATIIASPMVSAAERQRGAAAVAHDRAAREALLEAQEQRRTARPATRATAGSTNGMSSVATSRIA